MDGKSRPDARFKASGLMFLVIALASLYLCISFSAVKNHSSCLPRLWQPDAYQRDRELRVGALYGEGGRVDEGRDGEWRPGGAEAPPSDRCSPSELARSAGTVVLTTTNAAYLDVTDNWLASIRKTRGCPNITVVAEDEESYRRLSGLASPGLHVLRSGSGLASSSSGKLVFDTPEYKRFVNRRQGYILELLERGHEVLFSDVDTFWLRDPLPYLRGSFDMALEEDIPEPKRLLCAGFVHYRPTERTLRFVREWIAFMAGDKTLKPDQVVMNILIRRQKVPGLRLRVLDSGRFPNGRLFFNETWRRDKAEVVVVHNNWIIGHDPKVQRFRNHSMWLVGTDS